MLWLVCQQEQERVMPALGEVLERLHTAWDHLSSAEGTMRSWHDPRRTEQAFGIWRQGFAPGSVQALDGAAAASDAEAGDTAEPAVVEAVFRFWMVKPWRWRVETCALINGALTEPREVMVINGPVWWTWTSDGGVYTNARAAHPEQRAHSGVDRALLVMLDPAPLAGTLRMRVGAEADVRGRPCDVVDCTVRNPQTDPGLWPGAEHYTLLVDRQHGILLQAQALQAGSAYAETVFTDLALDQPIPDDRFVFEAPPGVRVHYRL